METSPLAHPFPDLPLVEGCRMGVANAGYKNSTRHDVTLLAFDEGTVAAGVTTQSKCPSPEVVHCRAILPGFKVPKRVLFVDDLPRNAMGKVQKAALRDRLAAP